MNFLRLLTLQIVEGRLSVEAARRIVIVKAELKRERNTEKRKRGRYRTLKNAAE